MKPWKSLSRVKDVRAVQDPAYASAGVVAAGIAGAALGAAAGGWLSGHRRRDDDDASSTVSMTTASAHASAHASAPVDLSPEDVRETARTRRVVYVLGKGNMEKVDAVFDGQREALLSAMRDVFPDPTRALLTFDGDTLQDNSPFTTLLLALAKAGFRMESVRDASGKAFGRDHMALRSWETAFVDAGIEPSRFRMRYVSDKEMFNAVRCDYMLAFGCIPDTGSAANRERVLTLRPVQETLYTHKDERIGATFELIRLPS